MAGVCTRLVQHPGRAAVPAHPRCLSMTVQRCALPGKRKPRPAGSVKSIGAHRLPGCCRYDLFHVVHDGEDDAELVQFGRIDVPWWTAIMTWTYPVRSASGDPLARVERMWGQGVEVWPLTPFRVLLPALTSWCRGFRELLCDRLRRCMHVVACIIIARLCSDALDGVSSTASVSCGQVLHAPAIVFHKLLPLQVSASSRSLRPSFATRLAQPASEACSACTATSAYTAANCSRSCPCRGRAMPTAHAAPQHPTDTGKHRRSRPQTSPGVARARRA
jgi:hypothetical protein